MCLRFLSETKAVGKCCKCVICLFSQPRRLLSVQSYAVKKKENTGKHIIKPFNSPIDDCFSSGQVEPHGGVYHVNI